MMHEQYCLKQIQIGTRVAIIEHRIVIVTFQFEKQMDCSKEYYYN